MTEDRLTQIRARLAAATPGPWFQGRNADRYERDVEVYSEREVSATSKDIGMLDEPADAEFIANARGDIPWLLDQLDKARAEAWDEGYRAGIANACAIPNATPTARRRPTVEIDLSAAVEAVMAASPIVWVWTDDGRLEPYRPGEAKKVAESQTRAALPHILAALIAKADADHDAAEDMSGYWAEASFHAAEWLRSKLPL